jgi:Arc/MetJ-type ribon-helix-helix transcriptional regulator
MPVRMTITVPEDVAEQLRSLVPRGRRGEFVVEATREWLLRERQRQALLAAEGLWSDPSQVELDSDEGIRRYLEETRVAEGEREAYLEGLRDPDRQ